MIIKLPIDNLYEREKSNYPSDKIDRIRTQLLIIEDFKKHESWLKETKNVAALNYTMSFVATYQNIAEIYRVFNVKDNSALFEQVIADGVVPFSLENETAEEDTVEISITRDGTKNSVKIPVANLTDNLSKYSKGDFNFASELLSVIMKAITKA